jgi:hypothetical protein
MEDARKVSHRKEYVKTPSCKIDEDNGITAKDR